MNGGRWIVTSCGRGLSAALTFVLMFVLLLANRPAVGATELVAARAQMLDLIDQAERLSFEVRVERLETAGVRQQQLVQIYTREFLPYWLQLQRVSAVQALVAVFVDRALYADEAEKDRMYRRSLELEKEMTRIRTAPRFLALVKRMHNLAIGLSGDLAGEARALYSAYAKSQLYVRDRQLLDKISERENALLRLQNDSTLQEFREGYERRRAELHAAVHAGEVSLREMDERLRPLLRGSRPAEGARLARDGRRLLQDLAVLRTELARRKGYASWAEYALAETSHHYSRGYRTVGDRIAFLRQALRETRESHRAYLATKLRELRATERLEELSPDQVLSLTPSVDRLLGKYFPRERLDDLWRETMQRAGFPDEVFSRVVVDSEPRLGKSHQAYMMRVVDHYPKYLTLKADTLRLKAPVESGHWHPGWAYIVQSFYQDGIDEAMTYFHEGGHALEGLFNQDVGQNGAETAYYETASMFFEFFIHSDREFLLDQARDANGEKPTEALIDRYIESQSVAQALEWRRGLLLSLFELLLWSEPFDNRGEDFVERSRRLFRQLWQEHYFGDYYAPADFEYGDSALATTHFTSGEMGYIGYVYAQHAAGMIYERFLDYFQATNGRRTLHAQPELGPRLIRGLFRSGTEYAFPAVIERFTGRKYNAASMARLINRGLGDGGRRDRAAGQCGRLF